MNAFAEPKFTTLDKLLLVGMNAFHAFIKDNKMDEFPKTWERFGPYADQIPHRVAADTYYGVEFYPPGFQQDGCWNYMAAVAVSSLNDIPISMVGKVLPASEYAVFTHKGLVAGISETFRYVYDQWLPQSGRKQAQPFDFELYDQRFKGPDDPESEVDIYLPIE